MEVETVQVTVNGAATELADGATVADLVAARSGGHDRVAVALNGDVVPRGSWPRTPLSPGDALEVLAPTAGG
ncbi:sulfur carrier protein ThiS [Geodermatophilus pulveris]|uniref:Sulfur carrier protein ThiS n=1 Tax=Geodermatophilus pulveris TaxID=1564159 RepID=A0A239FIU3_9ACTN|nr:sulfur carrier protein ThiS [Geodermatophilus pulveris]SNS56223.1 sulfur carrier protein ThiS [Geodermatophilus pulveris]